MLNNTLAYSAHSKKQIPAYCFQSDFSRLFACQCVTIWQANSAFTIRPLLSCWTFSARPRTYISLYKLTPNSCDANAYMKLAMHDGF